MADINHYVQQIENVISSFGLDPVANRGQRYASWNLTRGSARIEVLLNKVKNIAGEKDIFVLCAPIMPAPTDQSKKAALFDFVMGLNHQFISERYSVHNGHLYLLSAREITGMGEEEIKEMMNSHSYIADLYDDQIIEKFGNAGGGRSDV